MFQELRKGFFSDIYSGNLVNMLEPQGDMPISRVPTAAHGPGSGPLLMLLACTAGLTCRELPQLCTCTLLAWISHTSKACKYPWWDSAGVRVTANSDNWFLSIQRYLLFFFFTIKTQLELINKFSKFSGLKKLTYKNLLWFYILKIKNMKFFLNYHLQ